MSWLPRLRADVSVDDEGSRASLFDGALQRRTPIGRVTRALVARLRGELALEALLDEVARETGEERREVEGALRSLLLLNLIDDAGSGIVARVRAAATADLPEPRVRASARFGCVGSGQCCHVFRPGPLSDDDLDRLAEATPALQAAFHDLPDASWVEDRPGGRYLRRVDGRCLFLRPDRRCGVHAAAGRTLKPDACRMFPFDAVRTIDDLRVFDVSQCSAFATTALEGPTHAQQLADVSALLPRRPPLFHPTVLAGPGVPCDYGHVLPLEERMQELVEGSEGGGLVPRIAALARAFGARLQHTPLAAGQPDAHVRASLARDPEELPPPSTVEAALAIAEVCAALEAAAWSGEEREAPLAAPFVEMLGSLRSLAAARAGLADGPLPDVLLAAQRLPVPLDAALVESLRNRLFGRRLLVRGRLQAGILRLALVCLLTRVGARVRAAAAGRGAVDVGDVSAAHWIASLALARPAIEAALTGVEQHAWVVAAATALD